MWSVLSSDDDPGCSPSTPAADDLDAEQAGDEHIAVKGIFLEAMEELHVSSRDLRYEFSITLVPYGGSSPRPLSAHPLARMLLGWRPCSWRGRRELFVGQAALQAAALLPNGASDRRGSLL